MALSKYHIWDNVLDTDGKPPWDEWSSLELLDVHGVRYRKPIPCGSDWPGDCLTAYDVQNTLAAFGFERQSTKIRSLGLGEESLFGVDLEICLANGLLSDQCPPFETSTCVHDEQLCLKIVQSLKDIDDNLRHLPRKPPALPFNEDGVDCWSSAEFEDEMERQILTVASQVHTAELALEESILGSNVSALKMSHDVTDGNSSTDVKSVACIREEPVSALKISTTLPLSIGSQPKTAKLLFTRRIQVHAVACINLVEEGNCAAMEGASLHDKSTNEVQPSTEVGKSKVDNGTSEADIMMTIYASAIVRKIQKAFLVIRKASAWMKRVHVQVRSVPVHPKSVQVSPAASRSLLHDPSGQT